MPTASLPPSPRVAPIIRPIVDAPYGYYDGSCIDRFGIAWNIMYEHET